MIFNDIPFKAAALLNRFGFRVPEQLIEYEDENIDFSDDVDITDEDMEMGKILVDRRQEIN